MNGNMLRGLIVAEGYNMQTFAKAIGISNVSLSYKLTGKRPFTIDEAKNIARLLRLTDNQVWTIFFA